MIEENDNDNDNDNDVVVQGQAQGQEIVVCPDGPLLVRGEFTIVSTTGEEIPRGRKTVALCRCGASGIKPYCDGTHKLIGFRTVRGKRDDQ